tara:strand:- start:2553 stop:3095 length:543 start_codon:yes stop_codon:yes gene_type:complete
MHFRNVFLRALIFSVVFFDSPLMADEILDTPFFAISNSPYASDFSLSDERGKTWSLSTLQGKVVVLNFWATWCVPCRKELPSMRVLTETLDSERFQLLAINVGEDLSDIQKFIGNFDPPLNFPILLDTNMKVVSEWGVRGVPTTYIIDKKGRLVEFAEGEVNFTQKTMVEKLRYFIVDDF